jgi:lipopolysaccharide/colanic/teichoic acid biosynthesis glycosyltransferase
MSLVGPRAIADPTVDEPWLRNVMRVRPGLTGPAADASQGGDPEEQALKDVGYVRDYSIWLDLRLLFASLKRVLRRQRSLPASYGLLRGEQASSSAVVVERLR